MKKILFIGFGFYEYENKIVEEFTRRGNHVDYIKDAPSNYISHPMIMPVWIRNHGVRNYQTNILLRMKRAGMQYDIVFVLVGRFMTPFFLQGLKELLPYASFILYLWDDVDRVDSFENTRMYYDKIYSFDYHDCKKNKLLFRPLFYTSEYCKIQKRIEKPIDIFSAATLYSDRLDVSMKLAGSYDYKLDIYLVAIGKSNYFKWWIKDNKIRKEIEKKGIHVTNKLLTTNFILNNVKKARAVLDIQYAGQNGLTIRTMEMLGSETKMITTNTDVCKYDFYRSSNILIIDRMNPKVPSSFLEEPYKEIDFEIVDKYSLKSWVDVILENREYIYI